MSFLLSLPLRLPNQSKQVQVSLPFRRTSVSSFTKIGSFPFTLPMSTHKNTSRMTSIDLRRLNCSTMNIHDQHQRVPASDEKTIWDTRSMTYVNMTYYLRKNSMKCTSSKFRDDGTSRSENEFDRIPWSFTFLIDFFGLIGKNSIRL